MLGKDVQSKDRNYWIGVPIMLDVVMEMESIIKAVENKVISRSTGNGLIKNLLSNLTVQKTKGTVVNCGHCGKEHICLD